MPRPLPIALALLLTSVGLLGCPKPPAPTPAEDASAQDVDGGSEAPDATVDAGQPEVDAGPVHCAFDEDCASDQRCDDAISTCVKAEPCADIANCGYAGYCKNNAMLSCRCAQSAKASAPNTGFCKRRLPACTGCQSDEQCGAGDSFRNDLHEPGKCLDLGGTKVCLEAYNALKCPCGKMQLVGGVASCVPSDGTCQGSFQCCTRDTQCPSATPFCRLGTCQGLCRYDFASKTTVGCAADEVCNVTKLLLDPANPGYGAGLCGPSCTSDANCQKAPDGASDFVCKTETNSAARCRPGSCLDDLECPDPGTGYKGFCDKVRGGCACEGTGPCYCRTDVDPLSHAARQDCKPGYKCVKAANPALSYPNDGECVLANCVDQGGANNGCATPLQLCCGEDRPSGPQDPCLGANGAVLAQFGECYMAPQPPWCMTCQDDATCQAAGLPKAPKDPSLCLPFKQDQSFPPGHCAFSCDGKGCPKGFACKWLPVSCDGNASACGDAARCQQNGSNPGQNGGPSTPIMDCACTVPNAVGGECPAGSRCDDNGRWCVISRVCMPTTATCP